MIKDKKILFLTTTDNMIWQFLLPHIKHLQDAGNTVECACNRSGFWFDELQNMGLKTHEMKFSRNPIHPNNIKGYKQLKKLVKENKYDLIHCHQPVGGLMGRMIAKKLSIPVIYTAHGFHFYKGAPLVNRLVYKNIEKWASKYTDALVTMNQEDYEAAKKMKAKSVHKISGIGVDLDKYKRTAVDQKLKTELGIQKDDIVLLSVGELNQNKNHKVVIESLSLVENTNFKYIICGQGSKECELKTLAQQKGTQEKVLFLGFRKDIEKIYNLSDIFVMPSFREGLPKSQMEAMAYGLPVVASNIRGCNDLIQNNQGGYLVYPTSITEFADALDKLINDKNLRDSFGKNNLKTIQNYSTTNVLKEMEDIYNTLEK